MDKAISVIHDRNFLFLLAVLFALISYRIFLRLFAKNESYEQLYDEIISYDKYKVKGKFD